MIVTVLSPFTGTGTSMADAFRPLIWDVMGQPACEHVATAKMADGQIPAVNLMMFEFDATGAQLAALKSDNRFFVLSPGPDNTGNALTTWLSGKGAAGHGVTNGDDEATARAKLVDYCRNL